MRQSSQMMLFSITGSPAHPLPYTRAHLSASLDDDGGHRYIEGVGTNPKCLYIDGTAHAHTNGTKPSKEVCKQSVSLCTTDSNVPLPQGFVFSAVFVGQGKTSRGLELLLDRLWSVPRHQVVVKTVVSAVI